jgi:hypothetical protein
MYFLPFGKLTNAVRALLMVATCGLDAVGLTVESDPRHSSVLRDGSRSANR